LFISCAISPDDSILFVSTSAQVIKYNITNPVAGSITEMGRSSAPLPNFPASFNFMTVGKRNKENN